jgi:hypothetical protein
MTNIFPLRCEGVFDPVGMSSCSSANRSNGTCRGKTSFSNERELIPTDFKAPRPSLALKRQLLLTYLYGLLPKRHLPEQGRTG